jgi:hypothetical protein
MFCGRCCVTEPRSRLALRLDIFIEILPRTPVNRDKKKDRSLVRLDPSNPLHHRWRGRFRSFWDLLISA